MKYVTEREQIKSILQEELGEAARNVLMRQFEDLGFLIGFRKLLTRFIEQEVMMQFSDEGVRNIIRTKLEDELKSARIMEVVEMVVNKTIHGMNNHIRDELQTTKQLCYSIDSEIKHVLRDAPISYDTEQKIAKRIDDVLSSRRRNIQAPANEVKFLDPGTS